MYEETTYSAYVAVSCPGPRDVSVPGHPGFRRQLFEPLRSSSPFAGGSGTKDDPYQISSVAGLIGMNKDLSACYELVSDIDFDGLKAWMPVGYYSVDVKAMISGDETVPEKYTFHGSFNGNGHTIRNLTCASANLLASGVFGFTGGNAYLHEGPWKFHLETLQEAVQSHLL